MARILEVREVCERALRKIGTFSIRDSAANPAEFEEARLWLDMVVGNLAADQATWWLVPTTAQVTLVAGQADYDLLLSLPAGDPASHVVSVKAVNTTSGDRLDVAMNRRWEWEQREPTRTASVPEVVYIDRNPAPVLRVWPTPAAPLTHRLEIVFQRVSPNLTSGEAGERLSWFPEAWNLYLVVALAAQIGNGPVRKLPADEVRDMQIEAQRLLDRLQSYAGDERADQPRRIAYNDF